MYAVQPPSTYWPIFTVETALRLTSCLIGFSVAVSVIARKSTWYLGEGFHRFVYHLKYVFRACILRATFPRRDHVDLMSFGK